MHIVFRMSAFPVLLLLLPSFTCGSELKNVTSSVFGRDDLALLPLAFGDFNSDKLTDLVALHARDRSRLSVLLAQPQTFSLSAEEVYFSGTAEARTRHLTCSFDDHDVVGVAPADLDGDGGMDLAVSLRRVGDGGSAPLHLQVLWGEHDQEAGHHRLVCPLEAAKRGLEVSVGMEAEPLVLDGNGDNISDLYGQANKTRLEKGNTGH